MGDYRNSFYEGYVSRFKDHTVELSPKQRDRFYSACEYRYYPYMKDLGRNGVILELGSGPGYFLQFMHEKGFPNVRGIDVSTEQVDIARKAGLDAFAADVFEYLGDTRAAYDAIIAIDFVEHFHRNELIELARMVERALKPEGRFMLQTPNGEGLFSRQLIYGDLTHCTIFTPNSLKQLLRAVGFVDVEFSETRPIPRNLAGKARLVLWRLLKLGLNGVRRIQSGKTQALWGDNVICCCRRPGEGEVEEDAGSLE
ncbi:MAG: class I SAM-dependent methyltransferase [Candidatus Hydrogenedentota bacterium]